MMKTKMIGMLVAASLVMVMFGCGEQQVATAPQPTVSVPKEKIVVYISEHNQYEQSQKNALKMVTQRALQVSGKYQIVERSSAIDKEVDKQMSGSVDDGDMIEFGKQAGVKYVCVADMSLLYEDEYTRIQDKQLDTVPYAIYQVSARIVDVETAEILAISIKTAEINDASMMTQTIESVVANMLKLEDGIISAFVGEKIDMEQIKATMAKLKSEEKAEFIKELAKYGIHNPESVNLPKTAVYLQDGINEEDNNKARALYTYALGALFLRSKINGNFSVVDRSESFAKTLNKEIDKQHVSNNTDEEQVFKTGKQFGVTQIIIADIALAMNNYTISAHTADIENSTVSAFSNIYNTDMCLNVIDKKDWNKKYTSEEIYKMYVNPDRYGMINVGAATIEELVPMKVMIQEIRSSDDRKTAKMKEQANEQEKERVKKLKYIMP